MKNLPKTEALIKTIKKLNMFQLIIKLQKVKPKEVSLAESPFKS